MTYLVVRYHTVCSEFGCKEMTPLGTFTRLSAAKAERARLNKLRKAEVERRALQKVGLEYLRLRPHYGYAMAQHDLESARKYAGYDVPTFGIVELSTDAAIDESAVFNVE